MKNLKPAIILLCLCLQTGLYAKGFDSAQNLAEKLRNVPTEYGEYHNVSEGKQIVKHEMKQFKSALKTMINGNPYMVKAYLGNIDAGYEFKREFEKEIRENIKRTVFENQAKNGPNAKTVFLLGGTKEGYGSAYEVINELRANEVIKNVIVTGLADMADVKKYQSGATGEKNFIASRQDLILLMDGEKRQGFRKDSKNSSPRVDLLLDFLKSNASEVNLSLFEGGKNTRREGLEFLERIGSHEKAKIELNVGFEPSSPEKDTGVRASRDIIKSAIQYPKIFNNNKVEVRMPGDNKTYSPVEFINNVETIALDSVSEKYRREIRYSTSSAVIEVLESREKTFRELKEIAEKERLKTEHNGQSLEEKRLEREVRSYYSKKDNIKNYPKRSVPFSQFVLKENISQIKFFENIEKEIKKGNVVYYSAYEVKDILSYMKESNYDNRQFLQKNNVQEGPIKIESHNFSIKEGSVLNLDSKMGELKDNLKVTQKEAADLEKRNKSLLEIIRNDNKLSELNKTKMKNHQLNKDLGKHKKEIVELEKKVQKLSDKINTTDPSLTEKIKDVLKTSKDVLNKKVKRVMKRSYKKK